MALKGHRKKANNTEFFEKKYINYFSAYRCIK